MPEMATGEAVGDGWWVRNVTWLKTLFRVVFGVIWLIDGALKFAPGLVDAFPGMVSDVSDGQPDWLSGWFSFWQTQASNNPAFWVYFTGLLELALGIGLVLGLLRKVTYVGGAILSLFIWAVPEGFGGPYGPGSTDLGGGIVYMMMFLLFIIINAAFGPSRYSLDYYLERAWPKWATLAEFGRWSTPSAPAGSR